MEPDPGETFPYLPAKRKKAGLLPEEKSIVIKSYIEGSQANLVCDLAENIFWPARAKFGPKDG